MAEAPATPKKKKKVAKKGEVAPPAPRPADEGFLAWKTWAIAGALMLGGVIAWKLVGNTYKHDVDTICRAEAGSSFTIAKDSSKVTSWVREHLGTPEGNQLFSTLSDAPVPERADKLQAAADGEHVTPCALVAAYREMAAQSDARIDLQRLCSSLIFPKFLASDDDARLAMLQDWIGTNAKSPRTKDVGDQLKKAAVGPDRAKVLREAAAKYDVYTCDNAKFLEAPPPPVPNGDPIVRLFSEIQINGAMKEEDVKTALDAVTPAMVACYKKGIERIPNLTGQMPVRLQLDSQGRIVKDMPGGEAATLTDPETTTCIAHAIRTMKFPATTGPAVGIMLPLELTHASK